MDSNQNQNSNPLDFSQSGIAYKDIVPPGLPPNQVAFDFTIDFFLFFESKNIRKIIYEKPSGRKQ